MNWRRRLVRLWLVASAIWVVVTAAAFSLPNSIGAVVSWRGFPKPDLPGGVSFLEASVVEAHDTAIANLHGFAIFGLGLPAGVFVIG
jgi:hypothetical protein